MIARHPAPRRDCRSETKARRDASDLPFKAIPTPRSASAFAQRHLALLESTMDHSGPNCANELPRDIYVPMPKSVPVAALSAVPAAPPLASAPASTAPPASVLKLPARIPSRVGRDIKNEGNV